MRDWRKIVGAVAPTLATALGGPLAGVAAQSLSVALLGNETGTEDEIASAVLTGGADALAKIKAADREFEIRCRELDIDLERLHQADRSNAREREKATGDYWTMRSLGVGVLAAFVAVVWQVLFNDGGQVDSALAGTLIGYLSAKADQVVSYYFGSSRGSDQKTAALERAASSR